MLEWLFFLKYFGFTHFVTVTDFVRRNKCVIVRLFIVLLPQVGNFVKTGGRDAHHHVLNFSSLCRLTIDCAVPFESRMQ